MVPLLSTPPFHHSITPLLHLSPQFPVPNWHPWAPFVEPRWGSVIWAIGKPSYATRQWALEFNALGVKDRCWMPDSVCPFPGYGAPGQLRRKAAPTIYYAFSQFLIPNS